MGWVRLDDGLHDHPKFTRLTDLASSQLEEMATVGLWTYCRTWAARHPRDVNGRKTAGIITRGVVRRFAGDAGDAMASLLVKAELWITVDSGWEIHDAHLYEQPGGVTDPAEVSAKRAEAGRRGAAARWQTNGKPKASAKRTSSKPVAANGPANGPVPVPEPEEQEPGTAPAAPLNGQLLLKRFLDDFRAKTGSPYPDRSKGHLAGQIGTLLKVYDGDVLAKALARLLERGLGPAKLPDVVADVLNPTPRRGQPEEAPDVRSPSGYILDSSLT